MKILITGGSGFIGRYLTHELIQKHAVVVAGTQSSTKTIASLWGTKIPYFYCDYSIQSIDNLIREIKPNAIVNLSAQRLIKEKMQIEDYYINLKCTANIYESSINNEIFNIINVSTIGIYSQGNKKPWVESEIGKPGNYYSLSKQWGEVSATFFNRKGMKIKTLRLGQVIGLGEREGYALQIYLKNALKGLPITVFGQCKGKRHYVYVKDVVDAIDTALAKPDLSGIFNIGMDTIYGFDELANTINKVFGNRSEIIYHPAAKADESIYHMSIDKAKNELGWFPGYDLEQTYTDIKRDIRLHQYVI